MGSLLGPIEIGSRLVHVSPRGPAGGRLTSAAFAILCDNVYEKLIDFVAIDSVGAIVELISKVSRAR